MLTLAFLTSLANLLLIFIEDIRVPVRESYILEIITLAIAILLTYLTHERTRTSSTLLLLFWPAYIVAIGIWTHTILATRQGNDILSVVALKCTVGALGLITFILEYQGPESLGKGGHENPLVTANIYSRWTFGWMTPLMKKGAVDYITENDLPSLLPKDESAKLSDDLKDAIDK